MLISTSMARLVKHRGKQQATRGGTLRTCSENGAVVWALRRASYQTPHFSRSNVQVVKASTRFFHQIGPLYRSLDMRFG